MSGPAVDAAREAARDKTGEFGIQDHAESGVVELDCERAVEQALETSRVMETLGAYLGGGEAELDFDPMGGEFFRAHVGYSVTAINLRYPGTRLDVDFRIDEDGSEEKCLVALTDERSGMSIIDFVDEAELSLDQDAYGSDGARAVIGGLLGHRTRLQERLEAAVKQIKSSPNQEA